jgi:hypothetical protein
MASIVAGVLVLAITHLSTGGAGYGVLSPALAGVVASAVAFLVVHVVRTRHF